MLPESESTPDFKSKEKKKSQFTMHVLLSCDSSSQITSVYLYYCALGCTVLCAVQTRMTDLPRESSRSGCSTEHDARSSKISARLQHHLKMT